MSSDLRPDVTAEMSAPAASEPVAPAAQAPTIAPTIEPTLELPKADAASADIKPEIPADRVVSINEAVKKRFSIPSRASRYGIFAASMAIAAALGSVAGALAGAALMRGESETSIARTLTADALNTTLSQLSADLSSLKSSVETSSKTTNAQLTKISERVERAEKAQAETAQKTARLMETPKTAAQAPSDVTGSIVEKAPPRPPIVDGWVIRDVFDGRAMVESRRYGIYEVAPGAPLPDLGRVESVRRQDGRWVVVTPKGLIVSSR
jgi:hypothetical protein